MWDNIRRRLKRVRGWNTDDVEELLRDMSCDVLGSGASGIAIEFEDCVVKVFRANDYGYLAFLDIAMNCESPYLPKIYWFQQINKYCMAVALEKLTPVSFSDADYRQFSNMFYYVYSAKGDKEQTELRDLIQITKENAKPDKYGLCIDAHAGNFMRRGKQIVVIDPLCN